MKETENTVATDVHATSPNTVELDTPIIRGDTTISTITLRKPTSGELRGVRLLDLANMDVLALSTVLPRITTPTLTKQEVAGMDPADLTDIAVKVALFLNKKSALAEYQ